MQVQHGDGGVRHTQAFATKLGLIHWAECYPERHQGQAGGAVEHLAKVANHLLITSPERLMVRRVTALTRVA